MDNTEFETKIIGIDPRDIIEKLYKLGATEIPEVLTRRYVFDMGSDNIEWIRLRDNGNKVTMTYKYKVLGNTQIGKTVEIEIEVSDFDKCAQILQKIPFKEIFYQETKIHAFKLGDLEFSIATWPQLEPYLEVEGPSLEAVKKGLELLGPIGKDVGDKDIKELYDQKGINMHAFPLLKF